MKEIDSADLLNEEKLQSGAIFPIEQWSTQPSMASKLIILDSRNVGGNHAEVRDRLDKHCM